MASATMDDLSDANFDTEVLRSERPTIVEFCAPWSSACKRSRPGFEALAGEYAQVHVARINVDDNPQTASNYSVTNLPTFVLFEGGQLRARIAGSACQKSLRRLFERASSA